jgi:hypothetical protein
MASTPTILWIGPPQVPLDVRFGFSGGLRASSTCPSDATPQGRYTDRLACTELDTDCAPDGTTVVRGDGVHFCPIAEVAPCPVWSSGAVRFGLGIAAAANDPQSFE